MLNVTELRNGVVFKEDNNLLQVINYQHIKMGRGSGTIKVKVKNLKTGSVIEKSFITGARVNEANIEKKPSQFLYKETLSSGDDKDGDNFYFMDKESFEQFPLSNKILGEQAKFLKEGMEVSLVTSDDEALGIELPNSLVYTIAETGPEEKGNTISNVYKEATLDNSLIVKVPMFIKVGDKVKVDTKTGQYVERAK